MKRGRKRAQREKADKYDLASVLHGAHPGAASFAQNVQAVAADREHEFGKFILDRIHEVGKQSDALQAEFFDNVANYIRARATFALGIADAPRFLLRSILMIEYRNTPVDLGAVADKIRAECGRSVDVRWVSREARALGYKVRPRGRP